MQPDAVTEMDEARLACPYPPGETDGLLHILMRGMRFEAQSIYDKGIDNAPSQCRGCFAPQGSHRFIRARAHVGNIAQRSDTIAKYRQRPMHHT